MGMTETIHITAEQRETILSLLTGIIPGVRVWAYGSRVKGTSRPSSDLDLAIFADQSQKSQITALKEAFEESSLPFRVDVLVWGEIPENFRKNILEQYAVVMESSDPARP